MAKRTKGEGSRDKLRAYFLDNVGEILNSATLQDVAGGVSEWDAELENYAMRKD